MTTDPTSTTTVLCGDQLFDWVCALPAGPHPGWKHVGDGHSNVAIQAFYSGEEGHEARFGIAHFGFLVPDSKAMAERVQASGATVKARPAHRTQSEIRMRDPEGNGCDISQRR